MRARQLKDCLEPEGEVTTVWGSDNRTYSFGENPERYVGLSGQQVKDVLKDYAPNSDWYKGFFWANVVKYTLRFKSKGGVDDLKKAKDYLEWLIEEETNG